MQDYFGTKQIMAQAMTLGAYNGYRGWDLPKDEDKETDGYLVEYIDGGKPNHPEHLGYISWSPADVFEASYQPTHAMSVGHALAALRQGARVCREGWNGKGMWLRLVDPYFDNEQFSVREHPGMDGTLIEHPFMKTADGKMVPWLCSLTDMMANDWQILGEE